MASSPTVVLVHGAFADASGYAGVIRELQTRAVEVRAPMNPLRSLAFDAEAIARHATLVANLAQQMMELEELRRALCLQMARRARPKGARQPVRRATRPLVHCRFH